MLALLVGIAGIAPAVHAQSGVTAPYRLNAGDQISVTMALNPELNASGPVGPDGRFSIPLAGVVDLAGLTVEQAQYLIADRLRQARIVANARPNVTVTSYGGVVYVGGEVRNPGAVPLTRALNPLQAIISAGGLMNTARSKKIAVLRATQTGQPGRYDIDVRAYIRSGDDRGQVPLSPGDIIFVPRSAIAEVNLWIDQHINQIIPDALNFSVNFGNGGNSVTSINP